jgi:hypothetical protein
MRIIKGLINTGIPYDGMGTGTWMITQIVCLENSGDKLSATPGFTRTVKLGIIY